MTKPFTLRPLGLAPREKRIPKLLKKVESGGKRKEALERAICAQRRWPAHSWHTGLSARRLREFIFRIVSADTQVSAVGLSACR